MSSRTRKAFLLMLTAPIAAAAVAPATAHATATVKLATDSNGNKTLVYSAPDDERNDVRVSASANVLVIREQTSPRPRIEPGTGCDAQGPFGAVCDKKSVTRIRLLLGPGDDAGTVAPAIRFFGNAPSVDESGFIPATLDGGNGSNTLVGGSGDDSLRVGPRTERDRLDGGDGNDSLNGGLDSDVLKGGNDNDTLVGGEGNDFLFGEADDDRLRGGPDRFAGGDSSDTLDGGEGVDTADYGGTRVSNVVTLDGLRNDGRDANLDENSEEDDLVDAVENVIGGEGLDRLEGDANPNHLIGGPNRDRLSGGEENDTLDGGLGSDTFDGNGGTDIVTYADRNEPLRLSNNGATDDGATTAGVPERDSISPDVENMRGGKGPDVIVGNGDSNGLEGSGGNDTLDGAGGDDDLEGGKEDDRLLAGPGADAMDGGPGSRDAVDYSARSTSVKASIGNIPGASPQLNLDGEDANSDGLSEEGDAIGSDIEVLTGGNAKDTLRAAQAGEGTAGATLFGGPENDTLIGDVRNDTLLGGAGADDLRGGSGLDAASYSDITSRVVVSLDNIRNDGIDANNDGLAEENDSVGQGGDIERLFGGAGNDILTGNSGPNLLVGGLGQDRLRGLAGADTLNANDGVRDLELSCGDDFDRADGDLLDIEPPAIATGCESGSAAPKGKPAPVFLSKRSVRASDNGEAEMGVSCFRTRRGGCEGRLTLETIADRPLELGSSRYDRKAGEKENLRVDLSKAGRALLKLHGDVLVKATATQRGSDGRPRTAFTTLHLLRPN